VTDPPTTFVLKEWAAADDTVSWLEHKGYSVQVTPLAFDPDEDFSLMFLAFECRANDSIERYLGSQSATQGKRLVDSLSNKEVVPNDLQRANI
jgi:hypothetical protein